MNYIIGTAGHIDHGKTQLIYNLTGENTDRLEEEKERGISVDLGFAPLKLSDGSQAGIVDVPGHEKFVHNMLAGAFGVDLLLLVIDVREGIMPQTKEHLTIMELLDVDSGVIVLTKVDLEDEEWIELMEMEVREKLEDTILKDKPLVKVSNVTGEGIEKLKSHIESELSFVTPKNSDGPIRLPIDRVFKVQGFGTIVTGTLASGTLREDDEIEIVPGNIKTRTRKIQVYKEEVDEAKAGQRVAVNVTNVDREALKRGSVIGEPGFFEAVKYLDVRLKLLEDTDWTLKNGFPIHLHLGTEETVARVYFYENKGIKPGESTLCQLRLDKALAAYRNDKFIIRSYSPVTTIGGGYVIEHKTRKHRLKDQKVIQRLRNIEKGSPKELLYELVEARAPITKKGLYKESGLGQKEFDDALGELLEQGELVQLDEYLVDKNKYENLKDLLQKKLDEYHKKYPLRKGRAKAELMGVISDLAQKPYQAFLDKLREEEGIIEVEGDYVRLQGFYPRISEEDEEKMEELINLFEKELFKPPTKRQLLEEYNILERLQITKERLEEYLEYLQKNGKILKMEEELYYSKKAYEKARDILIDHFEKDDSLSVSKWRDLLGTTRRYAIPLLELFDQEKLIKREGDVRVPWLLKKDKI